MFLSHEVKQGRRQIYIKQQHLRVLDTACSLRSWEGKRHFTRPIVAQALPCSELFLRQFYMHRPASFEVVEGVKTFILCEIEVLKISHRRHDPMRVRGVAL